MQCFRTGLAPTQIRSVFFARRPRSLLVLMQFLRQKSEEGGEGDKLKGCPQRTRKFVKVIEPFFIHLGFLIPELKAAVLNINGQIKSPRKLQWLAFYAFYIFEFLLRFHWSVISSKINPTRYF